jgi:hypothetical protein
MMNPPPADAATTMDDSSAPPDDATTSAPDATSPGTDAANPPADASAGDSSTMSSGANLITNGDFSQGTTMWGIVSGTAGTLMASANELCVPLTGGSPQLGWPEPSGTQGPALTGEASYTLSYAVRAASANATVDVKVGHSVSPYDTDFDTANTASMTDAVTTTLKTYTHTFTVPEAGDTSAGLAFTINSATNQNVCFQAVSLVAN